MNKSPIPLGQVAATLSTSDDCNDCLSPHCNANEHDAGPERIIRTRAAWQETLEQLRLLPGTRVHLCNRAATLTTRLPSRALPSSSPDRIRLRDRHANLEIHPALILYCHAVRQTATPGSPDDTKNRWSSPPPPDGVSAVEFMNHRGIPAFSLLPAMPVHINPSIMRPPFNGDSTAGQDGGVESATRPFSTSARPSQPTWPGPATIEATAEPIAPIRDHIVHGTAIRTLFECIEDMPDERLRFRIEQQGASLGFWGRDFVVSRCGAGVLKLQNESGTLTLHPDGIKDIWLTHCPTGTRPRARGLALVDRSGLTIVHIDSLGRDGKTKPGWDILLDVLDDVSRENAPDNDQRQ